MSVAHRRDLARQAVSERHCSQRQACHYFNLHRSSYRYRMKYPKQVRQQVEEAIVRQSLEHPELGADKIGRLVRNHGMRVSNQRVRRLRRNEGLTVPSPKKKQCRGGVSTGKAPQKASYRGHVWSWDFIPDRESLAHEGVGSYQYAIAEGNVSTDGRTRINGQMPSARRTVT